jgi:hypothetical protein
MAGNEIDRNRAKSALEVIRRHPGMVLFIASPAILAVALVWWLCGGGWGFLLLVALILGGGFLLVRKR